ncbi:MAG: sigma-70 family RNA polymerase sigma factor [Rubrivivax sp.]|nr:MAG: sigma-70 family RNA polymerase sigma factor [Rubrivivax sp.]
MDRSEWNALVAAAHGGDRPSLEKLLRRTRADARRYAMQHCHASDVDDAVQETLLIVARKLSTLRIIAAYSGWLLRVVRRECCRLARRQRDHEVYDDESPLQGLEDRQVRQAKQDDALRDSLAEAIQALPGHYREVLLLRDVEGLALSEIATRLALTIPGVKSRLHRARARTREHLARSHPELSGKA